MLIPASRGARSAVSRPLSVVVLALAVLCLPDATWGQSSAASPVRIQLPPGMRVARVQAATSAAVPASENSASGTASLSTGTISQSALNSSLSTPSFGLDYTHQAVRQRFDAQRALIDPVTQHRLALERRIRRDTPIVPVIPFFPTTQVIVVQQAAPPPVIVVEQAATHRTDSAAPLTLAAGPAAPRGVVPVPAGISTEAPGFAETAAPSAPPLPDLEEMVLVKRDGEKILVVAYSHRSDHVMYITRDGRRRTLALADFDPEATRLANL